MSANDLLPPDIRPPGGKQMIKELFFYFVIGAVITSYYVR